MSAPNTSNLQGVGPSRDQGHEMQDLTLTPGRKNPGAPEPFVSDNNDSDSDTNLETTNRNPIPGPETPALEDVADEPPNPDNDRPGRISRFFTSLHDGWVNFTEDASNRWKNTKNKAKENWNWFKTWINEFMTACKNFWFSFSLFIINLVVAWLGIWFYVKCHCHYNKESELGEFESCREDMISMMWLVVISCGYLSKISSFMKSRFEKYMENVKANINSTGNAEPNKFGKWIYGWYKWRRDLGPLAHLGVSILLYDALPVVLISVSDAEKQVFPIHGAYNESLGPVIEYFHNPG